MAYKANIPVSTDKLSVSQGDILGNFQALSPIASSINTLPGLGFKWVFFAPQAATPPAGSAFPANTNALYSSNYAQTGLNELFVNRSTKVAGVTTLFQTPLTASVVSTFASAPDFIGQSAGWTYLPSGCLMIWGQGNTGLSSNHIVITYSDTAGFPGFTGGALPMVTRENSATPTPLSPISNFVYIQKTTKDDFTVYGSTATSANLLFTWFAIGR